MIPHLLEEEILWINIVCIKDEIIVKCRMEKRKGGGLFPKWWCYNCHRWVLPDKNHVADIVDDGWEKKVNAETFIRRRRILP